MTKPKQQVDEEFNHAAELRLSAWLTEHEGVTEADLDDLTLSKILYPPAFPEQWSDTPRPGPDQKRDEYLNARLITAARFVWRTTLARSQSTLPLPQPDEVWMEEEVRALRRLLEVGGPKGLNQQNAWFVQVQWEALTLLNIPRSQYGRSAYIERKAGVVTVPPEPTALERVLGPVQGDE